MELVLGSLARGIHHGRVAAKGEKKARRDRPPAGAAAVGLVRPSEEWVRLLVAVASGTGRGERGLLCGRALVKNDAEIGRAHV